MLFNSIHFFFFFPACVIAYYLTPHRYRWALLLSASWYFYASWNLAYLPLLLFSTFLDYAVGLKLETAQKPLVRRSLLGLSLMGNLGVLFFFKYYLFTRDAFHDLFQLWGSNANLPLLEFLLPVGISFYTFQSMSYTIDVYQGRQKAERHPGIFALYVSFFPQLVAGPIERSSSLLPQLKRKICWKEQNFVVGLVWIVWGLIQKTVISDRLAFYVNEVYGNPTAYRGAAVVLATYFFAFQIYCDFAGYSNIARGAARILGIRLMQNFDRPYVATSISDFWRRWHVSLSTWFRDYVYIPLGGNRLSGFFHYRNLLLVFAISGFWHGANWTFVIWGLFHGAWIVLEVSFLRTWLQKFPVWLRRLFVFHLVCVGWVFFRADSVSIAFQIFQQMIPSGPFYLRTLSVNHFDLALLVGLLGVLHFVERQLADMSPWMRGVPFWMRWVAAPVSLFLLLFLSAPKTNEFIYFQF